MRTRIWFVLSVLSALSVMPCARAQDGGREVALMPHWKKGETRRYTMVKGRRKTQGATVVSGKGTTPIRIEVLDANDAGYLIGWTAGETRLEDPDQAADPFARAMVDITKDVTIVLQLDSRTRLTGIRNWRQLQAIAYKAVDMGMEAGKKDGMDEATAAKIRRQVLAMFATRQQIELFFTRSTQLFFAPLGLEYPVERPLEYDDKLPNPLGGEPLPVRASFTLEKVDAASDTAVVVWRQEVDPVAGARILEKAIKDMAGRLGKSIPPGETLDFLNVKDAASFTLYLSSGWPRRLSHTRTTIIAEASQEDSLTFTEVQP